jgi:2-(1,2-epoxy-1,2-dihydrophenyl)acetyl-CoA isomerase
MGVLMSDRVLRCVIATAAAGNTLDMTGVRAATAALVSLGPETGSVLLASDGANFCTGGNVKHFAGAEDRRGFVGAMARELHDFVRALVDAPVPVVAGVHGWAAGAGMSIACAADITIGGPGTRFRAAYPGIGYSPDGGMSWTLQRAVGAARARDLILTDGVLTGEEAYRMGLLSRLVPDAEVRAEAETLAATLAAGPTGSLGRTKRLLWDAPDRGLSEHLDAEAASIAACADSPAGREGVAAFGERRSPEWPRG